MYPNTDDLIMVHQIFGNGLCLIASKYDHVLKAKKVFFGGSEFLLKILSNFLYFCFFYC